MADSERRVRRVAAISSTAAVASAALTLVALFNSLDLYSNVRSRDVRRVSETPPNTLGTCTRTLETKAVEAHLGGFYTRQDRDRCNAAQSVFEATAALNVHALTHAVRGGVNGTALDAGTVEKAKRVMDAVVYSARGAGRAQVRYSDVSDSMVEAAAQGHVPSCELLYPNVTAAAFDRAKAAFPEAVCNDNVALAAFQADDADTQAAVLLALCEVQFSYARSEQDSSALDLPSTLSKLEPRVFLWEKEAGINATSTWYHRAAVYTGIRYGMYMFYLVPVCILSGMLLSDAVLVVLAEASTVRRVRTTIAVATQKKKNPTSQVTEHALSSVRFRTRLAILEILVLIVATTAVLLGDFGTFGRDGTAFERPYCEDGGWKSDAPNVRNTELHLYLFGGAILSVPVMRYLAIRTAGASPFTGTVSSTSGNVNVNRVSFFQTLTLRILNGFSIGVLVVIADSIILQIAFGVRWARWATGAEPAVDGLKVYQVLRDFSEAAVRVSVSTGTMVTLLLGRYMFNGEGAVFTVVFFLWTGAFGFLLYQLVTANTIEYLFENLYNAARGRDVDFTAGTDYCTYLEGWPLTYCEDVRYIVVYTGVGVLALSAVIQFFMYTLDICTGGRCCDTGSRRMTQQEVQELLPHTDIPLSNDTANAATPYMDHESAPLLSKLSLEVLSEQRSRRKT